MNLKKGQWKLLCLRKRKKKRSKKSDQSLKDLWDVIKRANIRIVGIPEGEREKDRENI